MTWRRSLDTPLAPELIRLGFGNGDDGVESPEDEALEGFVRTVFPARHR